MKKQAFKNSILVLLAILLCVSSLSGCREQQETPEPTVPEEKETFQQLLGFESYEEITGTKLAVGNMLGSMEINTDAQYLTQGSGSMKLSVQGNYDEPAEHPYFKLDFLNTTCATCDFSKFRNIAFDVYNASEEELHIKASIHVGKEDGNYISTAKETFTLKPKSWTTCTYDLSQMAGFPIYDFTSVRYLTVEFMEHKESRTSAANVFYFDNLIGNYFAEDEQPQSITFDFYEGIDFETAGEELLFTGQGKDNDAAFERASYDSVGIDAPENGGNYGLRLSHESNFWPTFRINFGQELAAGTKITFKAYARIFGESLYNKSVFEFSDGGDATLEFPCDQWVELSFTLKNAGKYVDLFWNFDRAQVSSGTTAAEVYIDNMFVTDPEPPIEPEGNFYEGLGFEIPGNAAYFVGQMIEGDEKRDATIERVAYADVDIPALYGGEEYALRLSHTNNYWPTFRINFGRVLAKGTKLTFMAYGRITNGTSIYNQSIFEFSAGGEATAQFKCDQWTELTIVLPAAAEYIDLFWNYDRAQITSETASGEVYIDNFKAVAPIPPVGSFQDGIDFETVGNEQWFGPVGGDNSWRDATLERVSYNDAGITNENGGKYALKLTCASSLWPTFRIDFDETLPAGTILTFDAYIRNIANKDISSIAVFERVEGGDVTAQFSYNAWTKLSITLDKDCDHIELVCTLDRWEQEKDSNNIEVYLDNFKAVAPIPPVGSFQDGIDFETVGNEQWFGPVGGDNSWRDATLERVSYKDAGIDNKNGGDYALKLTCASSLWPTFRIDFGETLPAGTVLSLEAYIRNIANKDISSIAVFERVEGGDVTAQFSYNAWTKLSITLDKDCDHIELVCTLDRWEQEKDCSNIEVYLDNFKIVDPEDAPKPVGNFHDGINFETEGNELWFGPVGGDNSWRDATLERVSYKDTGIDNKNGGDYALKLTCASSLWPTFRIDFGETLPAGTALSLEAYIRNIANKDISSIAVFERVEGGDVTAQFSYNAWTKLSITLDKDCDHIELVCTLDRWEQEKDCSNIEVYLDNFKIVDPEDAPKPVGNFHDGINFETEGNELWFGPVGGDNSWRDATLERVSYKDAGIDNKNGGDYALKLTCASSLWPTFRIDFGETLPAGTALSLEAYIRNIANKDISSIAVFERVEGGDVTAQFSYNAWTKLSITLDKDCDHIELVCTLDRWEQEKDCSNIEVYLDNFKIVDPEDAPKPVGNFHDGINFETEGNELWFGPVGGDNAWRDATLERVSYKDAGIDNKNGGDYALKLTCASSLWPTFRIDFGETLPAGTVLSLEAYIRNIANKDISSIAVFERVEGGDVTAQFSYNAWTKLSITLDKDCDHIELVCTLDRWEQEKDCSNIEVYMDNFKAVEPAGPTEPAEPVGDFTEGVGFETEGNELLFGAVGGENAWRDATLERIAYADAGITAPANGGEYALKLTCASSQWPVFRMNFGKTLKAGTVISFQAYSTDSSDTERETVSIFESIPGESYLVYTSANGATNQYYYNSWSNLTIVLAEDRAYVDLMCNMDRWNEPGPANLAVYLDNFKAAEPAEPTEPADPVGDFTEGVDFETEGNELLFAGIGEYQSAIVERVTYSDTGVAAPANGGSYALKVSHASNCWPNFRVNFGKTLKAGTTITFDVYGNYDYAAAEGENKYMKLELTADSKNIAKSEDPNQVVWTLVETWKKGVTIILTADSDHVDLFYNVADGQHGEVSSWILLDNFKAVEPAEPTEPADPVGDFTEGVDFETEGNELLFAGIGEYQSTIVERVTYSDTGVAAPANGGSYALKVSHASNCWPSFRVNFGKTLKADTTITFDVYGNYDYAAAEGETKYVKLELTADSKNFAASDDPNQVLWTVVETWRTGVTITLTADSDHVDLFYNVADGQHGEVSSWILLDNFKAVQPTEPDTTEPDTTEPVGDFTEGVDFETEGNELLFAGIGEYQSAIVERVTYSDTGVAAPANGGSYALKVSHASSCWPNFRVNFGKTLKAGTTITFDVYGNYDYAAAEGETKYVKLELTADSKNFAASDDPNQVLWTVVETWRTGVTITLTADSDHVDLFYNVADGQHGEVSSWILLDNFKAVQPTEPDTTEPDTTEPDTTEPVGDFTEGVDFETEGNELLFAGIGEYQSAIVERVTYSDTGVAAPANGGGYALKVSHASSCWPSFRVNFGKTLKAGTTITFDVYGNYDYAAAEGETKYVKLELTADSKNFAASDDPNQVLWTVVETWRTGVTITLTANSDHVDLFYNVADGQHGEVSSWILLDNFKAVQPTEPDTTEPTEPDTTEPVGDFTEGVDFEIEGNELLFAGIGEYQSATVERVTYSDAGVAAPANGGSYALKVSHASSCWPSFRVNFGKTLKAGTTITFDVYGNYDYAAAEGETKYVKLELTADSKNFATSEDSNQVVWTLVETWKTGISITLTANSDHVDFFYNVADGQHGEVSSWILLDNFKAEVPLAFTGDFETGVGFEDEGDILQFTGQGDAQAATVERVSYADANVTAPANGGSYALKASHASSCWPSFRVNFGKTLKAGTTITFDVYGNYDYAAAEGVNKYMKLELTADSKNFATSADSNQVVWTLVETWKTGISITLTANSDHVDFFYNVADGQHGEVSSWILLDNFKAEVPLAFTGDFETGVGFEDEGDILQFTGQGDAQAATVERVSYADANVTAPANGGSYALKASHASSCWPSFRVNFGKTLKAGTTITFDVYGNYDYAAVEGVNKYMKLELTANSKNFATSADPNQVVWTLVETWKTGISITLTANSDHVDFFYNVADGQHGEVSSWILLDNFKATEPVEERLGVLEFEDASDVEHFSGQGIAGRDADIERVSYADSGIPAPENGGEYALKLSHESNYWPTFRLSFGKTLPADTKISFAAYGRITSGENLYNQSIFEYSAGGEATAQFTHDGWKQLTITLSKATDYLDLFWNYDRANIQSATASGEVYIDNMTFVEPQ